MRPGLLLESCRKYSATNEVFECSASAGRHLWILLQGAPRSPRRLKSQPTSPKPRSGSGGWLRETQLEASSCVSSLHPVAPSLSGKGPKKLRDPNEPFLTSRATPHNAPCQGIQHRSHRAHDPWIESSYDFSAPFLKPQAAQTGLRSQTPHTRTSPSVHTFASSPSGLVSETSREANKWTCRQSNYASSLATPSSSLLLRLFLCMSMPAQVSAALAFGFCSLSIFPVFAGRM